MNDPQHDSSSSQSSLAIPKIHEKKKLTMLIAIGFVSAFVFFSMVTKPEFYAALVRGGNARSVAISNFLRLISANTTPPLSPPLSGTITNTPIPSVPTTTQSPIPTNLPGRQLELALHRILYKDSAPMISWPDAAVVRYDCQDLRGNSSSGIVTLHVQQPVTVYVPILGNDAFNCTYEELLPQAPAGYIWLETQISTYSESTFIRTLFTNRLVSMNDGTTQLPTATLSPPPPTPTYTLTPTPSISKRVFISSQSYSGNLGGLRGADYKCQQLANTAKLGGIWKAWLSSDIVSASSRLTHHNGPYKRVDGTLVANNWSEFTSGDLFNPINLTEKLTTKNVGWVWTNSTATGDIRQNSRSSCDDWTKTTDGGGTGDSRRIDSGWTDFGASACYFSRPIYCIEQ